MTTVLTHRCNLYSSKRIKFSLSSSALETELKPQFELTYELTYINRLNFKKKLDNHSYDKTVSGSTLLMYCQCSLICHTDVIGDF